RPKEFRLTENYRSSRAIVRVANHLRPGALTETDFALEGEVRVYPLPSEEEEANRILSIVIKLMEAKHHPDIEGDISVDNMAVTARNRFVFSALEAALKEQNINYKLKVGEREKMPASFFGRALDSALRVKINPNDWVAGRKLCHILEIPAPAEWGNADLFDHFRNCLNQAKGVHNVLANELLDQINSMDLEEPNILNFEEHFKTRITEFAVAESDDEKKLEFDRSLEELQEFSGMWIRFRELGLGNTLGAFRNAMALGRLSPELPDDGLTLSTVHSMKGLEKDIVFLMGFCEGIFPDYRANTKAEIDEERNTAFVAVTRARRLLYITYPRSRVMPWGSPRRQSPSQFIAEMNLA
ncbi:MAG: ATP-dependent helicase, partial [Rhodobacteraceae bacterium]|nr:ATP-dependent helicase [Paracoccaceae bacterium]